MKNLVLIAGLSIALSGCVIAPPRGEIVVRPSVQIVYEWDAVRLQYYHVDRGHRHYMPPGWRHPKHPHGGPPGHRKHDHKDRD